MKKLVLIIWLTIISISPFIDNFMTLSQLELAFIIWMLWFFNNRTTKDQFNHVLLILGVFYSWIYLTDQFLSHIPLIWMLAENIVAFCAMLVYIEGD